MPAYITILRGINVSGHNIIPMKELKALMEGLGFENISTYIQSGNVVFNSPEKNEGKLITKIQDAIAGKFGFKVPVVIRTDKAFKAALDNNPFLKEKDIDAEKLHITFLADRPAEENIEKTNTYNYDPDRFIISGREVYVYCPNGYGNTKINNTFFENKLKVTATTRNIKTVKELVKMTEDAGN
ncbi:MAG TPA: DUF1697 domain-containing protein [Bacteroidia bacterium]|nr:DUF1697 domain-containing protein [Bacteroidia bacterium]